MKLRDFNILLIDDDEDDYVVLRGLFGEISGSRYHLTWKSTYEEGLKALQTQTYDVCLLDHRLGESTGLELLKEVQKSGLLCPVIFLTGFGDFDLDVQAMQMGASEYLVKNQLTAPLLERTIRYSMKHAFDVQQLKESKAQILQQDRLASLGLLASSLAHEIGTPLGIIRSRAELIERKASDEKLKSDMNVVVSQIDRIAKLVNSLLNLAREKRSDTASNVELSAVLDDVMALLKPEFQRNSIDFILNQPEKISVKAEAGPLSQVLLNLLVNSLHAIREVQNTRKGQVTVDISANSGIAEISIRDNGCGIPEKNLPQLFKPFFTTKDIGQGTGLGLATSYKLIQSWQGSITVRSEFGKETQFIIKLPLA